MITTTCPRCFETIRVPGEEIPSGAYATCPLCQESFPADEIADQLPPVVSLVGSDGLPINEVTEGSNEQAIPVAAGDVEQAEIEQASNFTQAASTAGAVAAAGAGLAGLAATVGFGDDQPESLVEDHEEELANEEPAITDETLADVDVDQEDQSAQAYADDFDPELGEFEETVSEQDFTEHEPADEATEDDPSHLYTSPQSLYENSDLADSAEAGFDHQRPDGLVDEEPADLEDTVDAEDLLDQPVEEEPANTEDTDEQEDKTVVLETWADDGASEPAEQTDAPVADQGFDQSDILADDYDQDLEQDNIQNEFADVDADLNEAETGGTLKVEVDPLEIDEDLLTAGTSQEVPAMKVKPEPRSHSNSSSTGSSAKTLAGIAVGPLLALPLAAIILIAIGKAPNWGFWPLDGTYNSSPQPSKIAAATPNEDSVAKPTQTSPKPDLSSGLTTPDAITVIGDSALGNANALDSPNDPATNADPTIAASPPETFPDDKASPAPSADPVDAGNLLAMPGTNPIDTDITAIPAADNGPNDAALDDAPEPELAWNPNSPTEPENAPTSDHDALSLPVENAPPGVTRSDMQANAVQQADVEDKLFAPVEIPELANVADDAGERPTDSVAQAGVEKEMDLEAVLRDMENSGSKPTLPMPNADGNAGPGSESVANSSPAFSEGGPAMLPPVTPSPSELNLPKGGSNDLDLPDLPMANALREQPEEQEAPALDPRPTDSAELIADVADVTKKIDIMMSRIDTATPEKKDALVDYTFMAISKIGLLDAEPGSQAIADLANKLNDLNVLQYYGGDKILKWLTYKKRPFEGVLLMGTPGRGASGLPTITIPTGQNVRVKLHDGQPLPAANTIFGTGQIVNGPNGQYVELNSAFAVE